jgi:hypothetical protein
MAVSIVDSLSKVAAQRADFVIKGNNIQELMDAAAASLVLQKAAEAGLNRPGVSNATGPYPVDAEGKTDDDLLLGKRGPIAGYQRDFVVLAGL